MLCYICFNFIIFLVFVLYVGCSQSETLPINRQFGLSNKACVEVCNELPKCELSKYTRRFFMCELFTEYDTGIEEFGAWYREKIKTTHTLNSLGCLGCLSNEVCSTDDTGVDICMPYSCDRPPVLVGVTTLGNMYSFGSKLKLACEQELVSNQDFNVLDFRISTCLSNGSWTRFQFSCTCNPPKILHGTVSVVESSSGLKVADITCENGSYLQLPKIPRCDPKINVWEYFDDVYCDKMVDGQWRKIYSFPNTAITYTPILKKWDEANRTGHAKYSYRNDSFIDNWAEQDIRDLRLSIISNDKEMAYVMFNGTASDRNSWFTKERLLHSSWEDLNNNSDVGYISWRGIARYKDTDERVILRHYINKIYSEQNCEDNYGWFVVTWTYFPCNNPLPTMPVILFSKNSTASRFLKGEIGLADRFEVWVN